jgi:hypothetical protein
VSRSPQQPVYSVTGARRGSSDDLAQRQRRYLISMGIRTACFLLAVVTHGPLRWILLAAAIVLPYVAVIMANAVGSGSGDAPTAYVPEQIALDSAHRESLGGGPAGPQAPPGPAAAPTSAGPAAESKPTATL